MPQRGVDRYNKRDNETCYQETFCYLFVLDLRYGELDTQTDYVRYDEVGQYSQRTETECFPEQRAGQLADGCQLTGCQQVLIADVEHTEQQSRDERDDHQDHRTLGVTTVVDMTAVALGGSIGREQERIEGVIETAQFRELTALLEVLTELLPDLIELIHHSISFFKLSSA